MKKYYLLAAMILAGSIPMWADIEDDIYYNPKQAAHKSNQLTTTKQKQSNYIADFQDMDVDAYNLRGQYYVTPVDTIGARAESEQDFKYTTQIQKFYNPTIVVDNEDILSDVLNNSYGNVTVEYNFNGVPTFGNWYMANNWSTYWNDPYLKIGIYDPWYWGPALSWSWGWGSSYWGWGPSWAWNPSWSWGWAPAWTWGPSWTWGWGPSWGWAPSYAPNHWADYRPGGNRPVGPNAGWANGGHRPNGNMANHGNVGTNVRPGVNGNNSNYNYGRQPGQGAFTSTTRPGNTNNTSGGRFNMGGSNSNANRGGYSIGNDGHRRSTSTQTGGSSNGTRQPNNNSNVSGGRQSNTGAFNYNYDNAVRSNSRTNNSESYNSRSYNSGNSNRSYNSGNSNRSSGSFNSGGHRSSGGSSGGGSRGSMGGGSRGGRR